MNKLFLPVTILLTSVYITPPSLHAQANKDGNKADKRILMVALNDNVKSNYFYKELITEETGISKDSIDMEYNAVIMENLMTDAKNGSLFVPSVSNENSAAFVNQIAVHGENEECYSDLSSVSADELSRIMNLADASYLLVLNRHYLKWQEEPLRTLFHIVSYSLFDKEKREIYRGQNYFTCMNPEPPDKLRRLSRKTSSRIATVIINQIK